MESYFTAIQAHLEDRVDIALISNKYIFPDKKVKMAPGWYKPFLSDRQNSSMIPTYPLIYTEKLESLSQASYINHML